MTLENILQIAFSVGLFSSIGLLTIVVIVAAIDKCLLRKSWFKDWLGYVGIQFGHFYLVTPIITAMISLVMVLTHTEMTW